MSTKNNPGEFDCYVNAEPDEEMFHLLGRDRHASALVQLWALIREKEGESPEQVAEARATAERMASQARARGKAVLSVDALLSFAASMRQQAEEPAEDGQAESRAPQRGRAVIQEGDIVVAQRGLPGRLEKIFGEGDDERVRGYANVRYPRAAVSTTIPFASLRRATEDEIDVYRQAGGRL